MAKFAHRSFASLLWLAAIGGSIALAAGSRSQTPRRNLLISLQWTVQATLCRT